MPQNIWKPVDETAGVWAADYSFKSVHARSTAIRLANGDLAIISPGKELVEHAQQLLDLVGTPKVLVVPNMLHKTGLVVWHQCFPDAEIVCCDRVQKPLKNLGISEFSTLEAMQQRLPQHIKAIAVPGSKIGEIWFIVETQPGAIWITCDAFMNINQLPASLLTRIEMKLLNIAPGFKITRQWKWLFVENRQQYQQWVLQLLDSQPPAILVPAHGDIMQGETLKQAITETMERSFHGTI